jgi:hypothetical protein
MNRRVTTAIVFSVLAASPLTIAQVPTPSASTSVPDVAPTEVGVKSPIRANREVAGDSDARRCLEFPTNDQVIRCAEKYLPRKHKG